MADSASTLRRDAHEALAVCVHASMHMRARAQLSSVISVREYVGWPKWAKRCIVYFLRNSR